MVVCGTMRKTLDPFRFLLLCLAGWMNQQQQHAINYLREEKRILRAQIGNRRLRFTDRERRRLAARAKCVGRKLLAEIAIVVTPETLLAWHRWLIAQKYDGSKKRGPGRSEIAAEVEALVVRMATENRTWAICGFKVPCRTSGIDSHAVRSRISSRGMASSPHRNEAAGPRGRRYLRCSVKREEADFSQSQRNDSRHLHRLGESRQRKIPFGQAEQVDLFPVRLAIFPAAVENTHPLERQRADCRVM